MYRIDFDSMEWQSPLEGVRFRPYVRDGKRIRVVEYTDRFVEPDWCAKGHIGYVLEGRIEVDFDGTPITFGPGDGIFIPPGEEHKHRARSLTPTARVVLVEDEVLSA